VSAARRFSVRDRFVAFGRAGDSDGPPRVEGLRFDDEGLAFILLVDVPCLAAFVVLVVFLLRIQPPTEITALRPGPWLPSSLCCRSYSSIFVDKDFHRSFRSTAAHPHINIAPDHKKWGSPILRIV
jgi:hypothetical protein